MTLDKIIYSFYTECNTGEYGINCSKSCGNCYNQSQCHNVDGSCSEGCSAGYKGSLCTDRKYYFRVFTINIYLLTDLSFLKVHFSFCLLDLLDVACNDYQWLYEYWQTTYIGIISIPINHFNQFHQRFHA